MPLDEKLPRRYFYFVGYSKKWLTCHPICRGKRDIILGHYKIVAVASAMPGGDILAQGVCPEPDLKSTICLPVLAKDYARLAFEDVDNWRTRRFVIGCRHLRRSKLVFVCQYCICLDIVLDGMRHRLKNTTRFPECFERNEDYFHNHKMKGHKKYD